MGLRQQMLLISGVDCMKETGPWLWEEVEKGTMPRPQLLHRGQRAGRRESPRAGRVHRIIKDQEKMPVSPSAWNQSQALCHLEFGRRAGVPSRKAGRDESRSRPAIPRCTPPCVWLESPSAQSFEHAHSACMVHLGTKALAGAAPPGPYQRPLNGELDLS